MIEIPERPAWMLQAACRGMTAVMYPGQGADVRPALAICSGCPVREPCLKYALDNVERFGIFGGTTEKERRRLRRARRNTRPPRPTICTFPACTNKPYAAGRCRRHHRAVGR